MRGRPTGDGADLWAMRAPEAIPDREGNPMRPAGAAAGGVTTNCSTCRHSGPELIECSKLTGDKEADRPIVLWAVDACDHEGRPIEGSTGCPGWAGARPTPLEVQRWGSPTALRMRVGARIARVRSQQTRESDPKGAELNARAAKALDAAADTFERTMAWGQVRPSPPRWRAPDGVLWCQVQQGMPRRCGACGAQPGQGAAVWVTFRDGEIAAVKCGRCQAREERRRGD